MSASVATCLDIREEDEANTVCQRTPHVRNAVNQVLFAHTIGTVNRQLDLTTVDGLLHGAITAAIDSDAVAAVHVARGTRPAQEVVGEPGRSRENRQGRRPRPGETGRRRLQEIPLTAFRRGTHRQK